MKVEVTKENEFVLSITDDGKNFNSEEITCAGRGIGNIKSRAALIEAVIFWRENESGGNVFQLRKKLNPS
jgi:signal transduction histidine kinase